MSRFPKLHEIAREGRSSVGLGFLTAEQRNVQQTISSKMPRGCGHGVVLPFYDTEKRTATVTGEGGSPSGGLVGQSVPEIGQALREQLVLEQLGARIFGGLQSDVNFPRARADIHAEWLSETAAAAPADLSFAGLPLAPRRIAASIRVSTELLAQGDVIEPFLRMELTRALAAEIQRAAVAGTGAVHEPLGIINTPGIAMVIGGPNGAAPTYNHITELEYQATGVGNAFQNTGWLVSPLVRRKLRRTFTNGEGSASVWAHTEAALLLGHPAGVTSSVPDTLMSTGDCSAIIFGSFIELIIGFWGPGILVTVNPFSHDTTGLVQLTATAFVDCGVRTPTAFAAMIDARCT